MSLDACPRCGRPVGGGKFCPGCGGRMDDPLSGKVLGGRYTLDAVLARGPFFTTWSTTARAGSAPTVVKVLAEEPATDPDRRRRFLENAGAALTLPAGGLLAVREMAEESVKGAGGRAVYVVADGPRGPSLADLVAREGPHPPGRAAAFVADLLESLGRLHGTGGVHGDLHPGCLYLEAEDRVRVADAGLAAGLAPKAAEDPAVMGSDGGRWLSPEQAGGGRATAASDLHAAGALLHFLLTGFSPWQSEKGAPLLFEIQRSFPAIPSEVRPGVPPSLDGVVDRALAKAPADRYPSAGEFLRDLRTASSGMPSSPARPGARHDTPGPVVTAAPVASGDTSTMAGFVPVAEAAPVARAPAGRRAPAAPAAGEDTLPAPRRSAPRPPSPDETLLAPRAVTPPRKPTQAKTVVPEGGARKQASAPSGDSTISAPRPPAEPPGAAAPAAPAAPAGKPKGAWSVGTPVAVFALLLFLGTGGLYAAVWAGHLDWSIPPWMRTLTGRHDIPRVREGSVLEDRPAWPLTLRVQLPAAVAFPMEGSGDDALFGTWELERLPTEVAGPTGDAEAAPARRVFATGEFRGGPVEGVLPLRVNVPAGRYLLRAALRYGDAVPQIVEVMDGPRTQSLDLELRAAVLLVRVRQDLGTVSINLDYSPVLESKSVVRGAAAFGLPEDGPEKRLHYGQEVTVAVDAEGYRAATARTRLLDSPQVVEFDLEKDPEDMVRMAREEIRKRGTLPLQYQNDAVVLGDPGVKIDLAMSAVGRGAWAAVDAYIDDLLSGLPGASLPDEGQDLFRRWHDHLRTVAGDAANRGDVLRVREQRAKARPGVLGGRDGDAERSRWAALEVRAWLAFPPSAQPSAGPEGAGGDEVTAVERMVAEDLVLAAAEEREGLRQKVAEHILEQRAWPAWNRGTELPPKRSLEDPPRIPGPSVADWLALSRKAWPGIEDTLSYQRLMARLEDIQTAPEKVVGWLLGDRTWTPDRATPKARLDAPAITKRDRLLLARALAWWGDLRWRSGIGSEAAKKEAAERESMALWQAAWNVYQTVFEADADFPSELAGSALLEGVRMASLTRGTETAREILQRYLAVWGGDREAIRFRDDLARRSASPPVPPARMAELGYRMAFIPAGHFRVGSETALEGRERPFANGEELRVTVLPARDYRMGDYLIGVREVTVEQYRHYLRGMANPENAKRFRHPREPAEKMQPGARDLPAGMTISEGEPVRGVDWWDAWACAAFLGGRLPTEAEWEKAGRWNGRPLPAEDPFPTWKAKIGDQWPGFWPDHGLETSPFDLSPSGVRGMLGGVAEWTMDRFDAVPPGVADGMVNGAPELPPDVRGNDVLMSVRGGSFFHPAPGEPAGPSNAEKREVAAPPAEGAPPPPPRIWRAMDMLERRGVPAGRKVKWIGFRVVVGG